MSTELKPCPFCGGAAYVQFVFFQTAEVVCSVCGAGIASSITIKVTAPKLQDLLELNQTITAPTEKKR